MRVTVKAPAAWSQNQRAGSEFSSGSHSGNSTLSRAPVCRGGATATTSTTPGATGSAPRLPGLPVALAVPTATGTVTGSAVGTTSTNSDSDTTVQVPLHSHRAGSTSALT